MSRNIFGEFMEVFLKGLELFIIQVTLKFEFFRGFLFQNLFGI
jgi:hypothetical protein